VGLLKLLKGTKLRAEADLYGYKYNRFPPYQVFESGSMPFADLLEIRRVGDVVDKFYNTRTFANCMTFALDELYGSGYDFFRDLSVFIGEARDYRQSLKASYTVVYEFLSTKTDEKTAAHYVKLDCLANDPKGVLPDGIPHQRDKGAEAEYRRIHGARMVRVEYFEFDDTVRTFVY
jgi:anaerobic magnesium-protoporphyrin IX monomethyl ester cyclase